MKLLVKNSEYIKAIRVGKYLFFVIIYLSSMTIYGQSPNILTKEAMRNYELNDISTAINKLNQAINIDSSYSDARIALGQIYLERNQPHLAEKILKPALSFDLKYPEVHFVLSIAYFEQGKYQASLDQLEIVLMLEPNNVQASEIAALCYLNLGVADYQNGLLKSAALKFNKSLDFNNKNIQVYQNLAVVLYESGKRDEVIKIVTNGLKVSPNEKILLKLLIQCYVEKNNIEDALLPAKNLFKYYPNDVEVGLQLAYIYRYINRSDEAADIYKNLIRKYPSEYRVYDEYADLYILQSSYIEAINIYEQFLVHSNNKSTVHQKIAEIYLRQGSFESAIASFRNALEYSKNEDIIYCKIAEAFISHKDSNKAIKTLNEGLAKKTESWILNKKLAEIYETINADSAIKIYTLMKQSNPSNPFPIIRLSNLYKEDNVEAAIEYSNSAIKINAKYSEPNFILAELYLKQKDTINALINFKDAARKSLNEITSLKNIFTGQFQKSRGRVSFNQLDDLEEEASNLKKLQLTLRSSLTYLFNIEYNLRLENDLRSWLKEYSEEYILLEYLASIIEHQNEYEGALSVYEQLIKVNPKNKVGHLGYARINEKLGKYNTAISAYKRALSIDTENPEIYHKLIALSKHVDRTNQLCEEWLIKAKREPENKILTANLRALLKGEGREKEYNQISETVINIESGDL